MREILDRLEYETRDVDTVLPIDIAEPAGQSALDRLASVSGRSVLPTDLQELYGWHNGGGAERWFGGDGFWRFRSIDSSIKLIALWSSVTPQLELRAGTSRRMLLGWPKEWIPFADWNSAVFLIADASGLSTSSVYGVDFEAGHAIGISPSLEQFFSTVLEHRIAGRDVDIDELMTLEE